MGDAKNQADKTSEEAADKPAGDVADNDPKKPAKEVGGRKGPEPTRYGDWENKGIASDF